MGKHFIVPRELEDKEGLISNIHCTKDNFEKWLKNKSIFLINLFHLFQIEYRY